MGVKDRIKNVLKNNPSEDLSLVTTTIIGVLGMVLLYYLLFGLKVALILLAIIGAMVLIFTSVLWIQKKLHDMFKTLKKWASEE